MYCTNCGTEVETDNKFCKECGQKIGKDESAQEAAPNQNVKIGELIYNAYRHKEAGAIEDAILACQGALALNDESAQAHALLSSLYELKGDLASAVHECERILELNPENAAERQRLDDLKNGRVAPPLQPTSRNGIDGLKPYAPLVAAAVVLFIVMMLGLAFLWSPAGKSGRGADQQAKVPTAQGNNTTVQPYPQSQNPQVQPGEANRPYPGQTQQPSSNQSNLQRPGIPPVPLPGVQASANSPRTTSQPPPPAVKENPVIVPVIEPSVKYTPAPSPPVINPSTSGTRSTSTPPPVQREVNPEQKGLELQRAGKYQEAISAYREALGRTSDQGRIYQQIALCYQRRGDNELAVDSYNRAISSYQKQLSSGRDSAEVQRNIKACEAGIQVSKSQGH